MSAVWRSPTPASRIPTGEEGRSSRFPIQHAQKSSCDCWFFFDTPKSTVYLCSDHDDHDNFVPWRCHGKNIPAEVSLFFFYIRDCCLGVSASTLSFFMREMPLAQTWPSSPHKVWASASLTTPKKRSLWYPLQTVFVGSTRILNKMWVGSLTKSSIFWYVLPSHVKAYLLSLFPILTWITRYSQFIYRELKLELH